MLPAAGTGSVRRAGASPAGSARTRDAAGFRPPPAARGSSTGAAAASTELPRPALRASAQRRATTEPRGGSAPRGGTGSAEAPRPAVAPDDALGREAALLGTARTRSRPAISMQPTRALATLERELPRGELLEERRILRDQLRCERGDTAACVARKSP